MRKGAGGKEEVVRRLRKLDGSWRVLHGISVGAEGNDIDHLVVGPGGVFTLNTKNHRNDDVSVNSRVIHVNGSYQPYLQYSRHEGARASKLLAAACGFDVGVRPVIVFLAAKLRFKGMPDDVPVVGCKWIAKWLDGQPAVLAQDAVDAIYQAARRHSTWQGTSSADR